MIKISPEIIFYNRLKISAIILFFSSNQCSNLNKDRDSKQDNRILVYDSSKVPQNHYHENESDARKFVDCDKKENCDESDQLKLARNLQRYQELLINKLDKNFICFDKNIDQIINVLNPHETIETTKSLTENLFIFENFFFLELIPAIDQYIATYCFQNFLKTYTKKKILEIYNIDKEEAKWDSYKDTSKCSFKQEIYNIYGNFVINEIHTFLKKVFNEKGINKDAIEPCLEIFKKTMKSKNSTENINQEPKLLINIWLNKIPLLIDIITKREIKSQSIIDNERQEFKEWKEKHAYISKRLTYLYDANKGDQTKRIMHTILAIDTKQLISQTEIEIIIKRIFENDGHKYTDKYFGNIARTIEEYLI